MYPEGNRPCSQESGLHIGNIILALFCNDGHDAYCPIKMIHTAQLRLCIGAMATANLIMKATTIMHSELLSPKKKLMKQNIH